MLSKKIILSESKIGVKVLRNVYSDIKKNSSKVLDREHKFKNFSILLAVPWMTMREKYHRELSRYSKQLNVQQGGK